MRRELYEGPKGIGLDPQTGPIRRTLGPTPVFGPQRVTTDLGAVAPLLHAEESDAP